MSDVTRLLSAIEQGNQSRPRLLPWDLPLEAVTTLFVINQTGPRRHDRLHTTRASVLSLRHAVCEWHETDGRFHPSAATASATPFWRKQHATGRDSTEPAIGAETFPGR